MSALMRDLRTGQGSAGIKFRTGMLAWSRAASGWDQPDGMIAIGFFEHPALRGALQELPEGSVRCPIPSSAGTLSVLTSSKAAGEKIFTRRQPFALHAMRNALG